MTGHCHKLCIFPSTNNNHSVSVCLSVYVIPTCALNVFHHRKKVLDVSEMESEFGNDLDFLMARISCCVDDKSVSKHTCTRTGW